MAGGHPLVLSVGGHRMPGAGGPRTVVLGAARSAELPPGRAVCPGPESHWDRHEGEGPAPPNPHPGSLLPSPRT